MYYLIKYNRVRANNEVYQYVYRYVNANKYPSGQDVILNKLTFTVFEPDNDFHNKKFLEYFRNLYTSY